MVLSMPAKKMKVEVQDENGDRYTITFEGRVSRDKALRIFDIVELLGGTANNYYPSEPFKDASRMEKARFVVVKFFPLVWFSPKEAKEVYEKEINEPIGHSAISTYLSRLSSKGFLIKRKKSSRIFFKLTPEFVERSAVSENLHVSSSH